jgi:hypothetical protein
MLNVSGFGTLAAVAYAVFLDADKAGPAFEQRTAYVASEGRQAVAPLEDRVYYTKSKAAPQGPPNRRRIL